MNLPNPQITNINSVVRINGKAIAGGEIGAAQIAYVEGASALAKMFREAIYAGDIEAAFRLAKATETNSFYGE